MDQCHSLLLWWWWWWWWWPPIDGDDTSARGCPGEVSMGNMSLWFCTDMEAVNMSVLVDVVWPPAIVVVGGLMRFSFCLRLQNHTRTTSFSMDRLSAKIEISSDVGLGFALNAFSNEYLMDVSMDVRFLRRLPIASGVVRGLHNALGLVIVLSASTSHFCNNGFSLHMFLKDRFSASNLEMVVWEKSLPYSLPIARPTSPWVNPVKKGEKI